MIIEKSRLFDNHVAPCADHAQEVPRMRPRLTSATSEGDTLTDLIECKLSDPKPHRALVRFAEEWPAARATQLVRNLRHAHEMGRLRIQPAAAWLDGLAA
jgi:hypothetical protein